MRWKLLNKKNKNKSHCIVFIIHFNKHDDRNYEFKVR